LAGRFKEEGCLTKHILLVDDDALLRRSLAFNLEQADYRVSTCANAEDALALIVRDRPDLVLLDIKLPDMDGMEILKILREKRPEVCVIVMTGYSTMSNAVQAMKLGAADYLSKPFTDDELMEAIEKIFSKTLLNQ